MRDMVDAMGNIKESGENIRKIIKVIDEIAVSDQPAGFECCGRKPPGPDSTVKGFAVVAEEVRQPGGTQCQGGP